jgi:NADH-quinone oxidoreductase subunit J
MFKRYVWAFELTSALLITAALGAMVMAYRERVERERSQRELAEQRFKAGGQVTPLPPSGVYARHNAVDTPALLPDGTPSELSVPEVLQARGDVRTVAAARGLIEPPAIEDSREARESSQLGKGPTP